ncbi:MAG: hypothetical protein R2750_02405, partial [Bacteroidales bacterium]
MKKLTFTFCLVIALTIAAIAQIPQAVKYQAVVRDNMGEILQTTTVGIRINIHDATAGGTIIYQETFTETTNQFGLVTLEIGTGSPTIGTFPEIDWGTNKKFIEVEIDQSGGTNYASMGTSEIVSVPYALYAEGTGNVESTGLVKIAADTDQDGDGQIELTTGDTVRMVITEDGRIGIGTLDPDGLFQVGTGSFKVWRDWPCWPLRKHKVGINEDPWGNSPDAALEVTAGCATRDPFMISSSSQAPDEAGDLVIVKNDGRVGINTTTPDIVAKLDVNGLIKVSGGDPSDSLHGYIFVDRIADLNEEMGLLLRMDGDGDINDDGIFNPGDDVAIELQSKADNGPGSTEDTTTKYRLWTDGSAYYAGNVGIGTTIPNEKLEVNGSIRMTDGSQGDGKVMVSDADGTGTWAEASSINDNDWEVSVGGDVFTGHGTGGYPSGNVGIGTTSPNYRLSIQASGNDSYLSMSEAEGAGADGFEFQIAPGNGSPTNRIGYLRGNFGHIDYGLYIYNERDAPLRFGTNNVERIRILGNGNVGIGTTNPLFNLHIASSGQTKAMIEGDDYGALLFGDLSQPSGEKYWVLSSDDGIFRIARADDTPSGFDEAININQSDNVGIGTSTMSPSEKLDVNGKVRVRTLLSGDSLDNIVVAGVNGVLYKRDISSLGGVDEDWAWSSGLGLTGDIYHTGKVGIGTTSPDKFFTVQASVYNDYVARFQNSWGSNSDGVYIKAGLSAVDDALRIDDISGSPLFIVRGGSRIGIGTASPLARLDIDPTVTGGGIVGTYYGIKNHATIGTSTQ